MVAYVHEDVELCVGGKLQAWISIGVVLALSKSLVVGYWSSKFQSPRKNIGKLVFKVRVNTYNTSTYLEAGLR